MEKEYLHGQMGENTKVCSKMIIEMGLEFYNGLMVELTKDSGKKTKNKDQVGLGIKMEFGQMVFGKMIKK